MARTRKIGLEYFPLDVDMFQDIRIRKLIKYQGGKAVTVYTLLLCIIYKDGYYMRWDEELPFIISEQTGFDEAYIQEVIKCCMSLGLFDSGLFENEKIITSKGIQVRYRLICEMSRRAYKIDTYSLIAQEKDIPAQEKDIPAQENTISSAKIPQSKVKESKVKESKSLSGDFAPEKERERVIDFEKLKEWFNYYVEHNHSALKPIKKISDERQVLLNTLLEKGYSKEDIQAVIKKATESPQLNGRGRNPFKNIPSFDWLFAEENFLRILEGNFDF